MLIIGNYPYHYRELPLLPGVNYPTFVVAHILLDLQYVANMRFQLTLQKDGSINQDETNGFYAKSGG